jgi:4-hydroxymandelate oxidase
LLKDSKLTEARPKPSAVPDGVVCLGDYERLAEQRLDANAWAYLAGASADEITARWNREAFTRTALLPRVLRASAGGHTRIELFGKTFEHPIFVAPLAHLRLSDPDGERAMAKAAAAQQAGLVVSTLASTTLEEVAEAAGPRRWFQLYVLADRSATLDLVRRAEAAQFEAIVVTVDAPVSGVRNREERVGFRLPQGIGSVNLANLKAPPISPEMRSAVFDYFVALAPVWSDIDWLCSQTRLPVLLKGILAPDDAALGLEHGAAGIIVSNHGGRTLDTSVATFDMLAPIVDRVEGRAPVLIDGGIRRGTDVLKCLAVGARAVLVGRPIVFGLAVAGALGVSHVLRLLRDELEVAMALTGCNTIGEIDRALLIPAAERR